MIIGSLGDIVFSVSPDKVNTIKNIKWKSSARYAEHDLHLSDTILEFVGNDAEEFSFDMHFSVHLGIDPIEQITKILTAKRSGKTMLLMLGKKAYGKNKWVITGVNTGLTTTDGSGNVIEADVTVTLKAYTG